MLFNELVPHFQSITNPTPNFVDNLCKSVHTSQVAHQAGAYPGFRSMKRLGVFLLPPGWDASPSQGYPEH